jgi:hypothetical protein
MNMDRFASSYGGYPSGCAIYVTFRPASLGEKYATLKVLIGDNTVRTRDLREQGYSEDSH